MAQTYTLDEAADKLNLSVEEFKRRLRTEWTQVRSFRDGSTLRFRSNEIDELARTFGLGSSDELQLTNDSDSFVQPKPASSGDSSAKLDTDEIFLISPEGSSAKLRGQDSDIRLEKSRTKAAKQIEDEESIMSEDLQSPAAGGSGKLTGRSGKLSSSQLKSGDSGKLKSGDSGKSKKKTEEDDSSEFELSLDVDSDEFTLAPDPDSSEEVALGDLPAPSPSAKSGQSGINLNRPADSGVSLEKHSDATEDIDFELSLDAPGSGKSSKKGSSGKLAQPDSDSEFELTLEEPSDFSLELTSDAPAADEKKNDIFEATDFEIPALEDESSEAAALDESDTDLESSSDFDLALDDSAEESGSEVVALDDEEDAPKAKAKKAKKKARSDDDDDDGGVEFDDELEDGASASMALKGASKRRLYDEDDEDLEVSVASDDDDARPGASADWGKLPIALLVPTMIFLFLGAIMAYEVIHSVWGYSQENKPTTPIVSGLADLFGMAPAK